MDIKFETGTSNDEIKTYIRNLLEGKIPDDEIEDYISKHLHENLVIVCDSCNKEMESHNSYNCEGCNLTYDLCESCDNKNKFICPEGFGCSGKSGHAFIPQSDILKHRNLDDIHHYNNIEEIELIYIMQKDIPTSLFKNLWLYFRTTNTQSIDMYGYPRNKVYRLNSENIYEQIKPLFISFIMLENTILRISFMKGSIIIKRDIGENPFMIYTLYYDNNLNDIIRSAVKDFDNLEKDGEFFVIAVMSK